MDNSTVNAVQLNETAAADPERELVDVLAEVYAQRLRDRGLLGYASYSQFLLLLAAFCPTRIGSFRSKLGSKNQCEYQKNFCQPGARCLGLLHGSLIPDQCSNERANSLALMNQLQCLLFEQV
jgi:hypothetical protein